MKKFITKIIDYFLIVVLTIFMAGSLVFINFLQMVSMIILPFSKKLFRKINRFFANSWWGAAVICMEKIRGINIQFSGDEIPEKENVIVIANHQQMSDIPVLFSLASRKKCLGDMKWFMKDVIKYVPGVGWGMFFLDGLFVKRNWHADKDKIKKTFKKFHREKIPIWLMIFPEGTRLKPHKLRQSQEFAQKKNLFIPQNVLLPRTKGFTASVEGLRKHVDAIYDVTIQYKGKVPTLRQFICGRVKNVNMHVRRYGMSSMPLEENKLNEWLYEKFLEKDALLESSH